MIEKKTDKNFRTYACGCTAMRTVITRTLEKETKYYPPITVKVSVWRLLKRCHSHEVNFAKKADKAIHKHEKKGGRGYTKSSKPLEKRGKRNG